MGDLQAVVTLLPHAVVIVRLAPESFVEGRPVGPTVVLDDDSSSDVEKDAAARGEVPACTCAEAQQSLHMSTPMQYDLYVCVAIRSTLGKY